jgi:hypothetical protein
MDKKIAKSSDLGKKERYSKQGGLMIEAAELSKNGKILSQRAKAKYPSSLHWYYKKGTISEAMLEAGTIFAALFDTAQVSSSPQSCLKSMIKVDVSRGGSMWASEFAEDARRKLNKCYDLLTPLEMNVIRDVAGLDNRASGDKRVLSLKTGLRALCVYFRIPAR